MIRVSLNGRNRKIVSGLLGFIPYAGKGARFVRGADIRIDPKTLVTAVLDRRTNAPRP